MEAKRLVQDGMAVSRENTRLIRKRIRSLEEELDRRLYALNQCLAKNRGLLLRVSGLRRERMVQDGYYTEAAAELRRREGVIMRAVKQCTHAEEKVGACERDACARACADVTARRRWWA